MSYRRLKAVLIKELHHIVRDSRSLGMALAVPVMMLLLYGYALSLDVDHVPTLIYDQDKTEASQNLIQEFRGSKYFEIRGVVDSYGPIERGIDSNRILMGVTIPRGYGGLVGANRVAPVQILLDGSDSNTASIVLGYAESLVRGYSFQLRTQM